MAFKQFIPLSAPAISRGDEIAILNGEGGEWAGRPQVRIGPGTRVVILKHAEDTIDFYPWRRERDLNPRVQWTVDFASTAIPGYAISAANRPPANQT